ncbi:uncharacterized protein LOC100179491 [Ciona intestinalis]
MAALTDKYKQFVVDTLRANGALPVSELLKCFTEGSKNTPPNCPKFLKTVSEGDLYQFLLERPDVFCFKKGYVCLTKLENSIKQFLLGSIGEEGMSFCKFENLYSDKANNYIKAVGWQQGAVNFLFRNQECFFRVGEKVYKAGSEEAVSINNLNEDEVAAALFFGKILQDKGNLTVVKLAGHLNQASSEIRNIVGSTKPEIFREFILKNEWLLKLNDDVVSVKSTNFVKSLQSNIKASSNEAVEFIKSKFKTNEKKTFIKLAGSLSQAPPDVISIIGGKSPASTKQFLTAYPTVFNIDGDVVSLVIQPVDYSPEFHSPTKIKAVEYKKMEQLSLYSSEEDNDDEDVDFDKIEKKAVEFFSKILQLKRKQSITQLAGHIGQAPKIVQAVVGKSPSKIEVFLKGHSDVFETTDVDAICLKEKLTGDGISFTSNSSVTPAIPNIDSSWDTPFLALGNTKDQDDFDNILAILGTEKNCFKKAIKDINEKIDVICFGVGSKPSIRLDDGMNSFRKLDQLKNVTESYLLQIIEHPSVFDISEKVRGIRNSLHTIRLSWDGENISGMTIFNQVHNPNVDGWDNVNMDFDGIAAVVFEPEQMQAAYSYLRNRARKLAETSQVIVIDYNGKITGFDTPTHIGNARRIICTEEQQLRSTIFEAASHYPDHVITNCCITNEYFKLLRELRYQGIKVTAMMAALHVSDLED